MQGGSSAPSFAALKKPMPAPELSELARLVGNWSGSAELVAPFPDRETGAPGGAPGDGRPSFKGGGKFQWVLDGMFLKGEGWHDLGGERRIHYVEYVTWDSQAEGYRNWWFNNFGAHGQGWMTFDADGKTIRVKTQAIDVLGQPTMRTRTMTFIDDNVIDWTWSEDGPTGKLKLIGTSRREP
jgi:hypothetical protein